MANCEGRMGGGGGSRFNVQGSRLEAGGEERGVKSGDKLKVGLC